MISIIIPVYNQHDMTSDCINTIREHTPEFELVVIDNGSDPPYKPPFTGFCETVLIRNDKNKGFPVAANQGIKKASGDIIVLLNNDVIVTPQWSDRLIGWLDEFAIVGPLTNYCAGIQATTAPFYDNKEDLELASAEISAIYEGHAVEVNFIIGFCMAFKKSLFEEIGPLDESLWPCSGEEIDFCFRAVKAGHKVGVAYDVYVHHFGGQTFNDMQKSGKIEYVEIVERNDKHLGEKWGEGFWERQAIE
jgi:GT2 family glycosyltransferase